jgi:hypothetical protein
MNIFETAQTHTKQGDIGEARAILEYTKLGYQVSRTLFDSAKYDLIIDDGKKLQRVQVRTSTQRDNKGRYRVGLVTSGGNTKKNIRRPREDDDYDILFALTSDDRSWSIPANQLGGVTSIVIGGTEYSEYQISGVRLQFEPSSTVGRRTDQYIQRQQQLAQKLIRSDIDFSRRGWVRDAAAFIGRSDPGRMRQWMKTYLPEFYETSCYKIVSRHEK